MMFPRIATLAVLHPACVLAVNVAIFPNEGSPLPLPGEDGVSIVGVRYRYAFPEPAGGGEVGPRVVLRARARHVIEETLVLPTLPGDEVGPSASGHQVDPEVPGWAYADEKEVRP